jgi:hypothetical protein
MPSIKHCSRFDLHNGGATGPTTQVQLPGVPAEAVKMLADALAHARAARAVLATIKDRVNDLKAEYSCDNRNCSEICVHVDNIRFEQKESAPRGGVWRSRYDAFVVFRVHCTKPTVPHDGGDGPKPPHHTEEVGDEVWNVDETTAALLDKLDVVLSVDGKEEGDCGC